MSALERLRTAQWWLAYYRKARFQWHHLRAYDSASYRAQVRECEQKVLNCLDQLWGEQTRVTPPGMTPRTWAVLQEFARLHRALPPLNVLTITNRDPAVLSGYLRVHGSDR